ncbi:MAG: hypothetical protein K2P57_07105 [Burkholderiales bacterium]|nr:hypothetical protein [Burkholderiales bacterium]
MKSEDAANYWNSRQDAKKPERFYLTAVKFSMVTEALTTLEQSGLIDADESRRLRQKFLDARPGFEDALNKLFGGYE